MQHLLKFLVFFLILPGVAPAGDISVAPDWTLASAEGDSVRLSDEVQEQAVVLLFWATWCPYCKALMPHLQSLRLEHGDSIKILAINFKDKDGVPRMYTPRLLYADTQKLTTLAQEMLDALARAKGSEDWLKEDGKWIPRADNWLNDQRWEDEETNSPQIIDSDLAEYRRQKEN